MGVALPRLQGGIGEGPLLLPESVVMGICHCRRVSRVYTLPTKDTAAESAVPPLGRSPLNGAYPQPISVSYHVCTATAYSCANSSQKRAHAHPTPGVLRFYDKKRATRMRAVSASWPIIRAAMVPPRAVACIQGGTPSLFLSLSTVGTDGKDSFARAPAVPPECRACPPMRTAHTPRSVVAQRVRCYTLSVAPSGFHHFPGEKEILCAMT